MQALDFQTQYDAARMYLKSLNADLEVVISVVELEMRHLRGELTPNQVVEEFEKQLFYSPAQ